MGDPPEMLPQEFTLNQLSVPAIKTRGRAEPEPAQEASSTNVFTPNASSSWQNVRFELPRSNTGAGCPLPQEGAGPSDSGRLEVVRTSGEASISPALSPRSGSEQHFASNKSFARRVQARADQLRKVFGLESSEPLMDDFMCALKKRVLLQGRVFVFERHLCFYSSLFGFHKVKVIPLAAVLNVHKRKNVGLPNSVEVVWAPPGSDILKKEFFTSFLNRQDAYRLIVGLWAQCSERGRQHVAAEEGFTEEEDGRAGAKRGRLAEDVRQDGLGGGGVSETDERMTPTFGAMGPNLAGTFWDAAELQPGGDVMLSDGDVSMEMQASLEDAPGALAAAPGGVPEFVELPSCKSPALLDAEFESATDPPPPLSNNMQRVLKCALPCSPRDFYRAFLCSSSDFFTAFHLSQNHHSIRMSPWQRHYAVGPVRDLRFVTPIKGWRLGPSQTMCHQTQRYRVYKGEVLVFETSQVMTDIPYGDCFKVETRWDVGPGAEPNTCSVEIHIAVPFTKSTVWRKMIEKSVTDSSLEAYTMFKGLAEKQLEIAGQEQAAAAVAVPAAIAAGAPGHRRQPSRQKNSPEETLPSTNEEWEALLQQVEPQWRGGLRVLRRMQLSGGSPSAPRHRRRNSRTAELNNSSLLGVSPPKLPKLAERSAYLPVEPQPVQVLPPRHAWQRWRRVLLGLLVGGIVCLQCVLLALQLRQPRRPVVMDFAAEGGAAGAARAALARDIGDLAAQLQALRADAQAWRGQMDGLIEASAGLAQRAAQLQQAIAPGGTS